MNGEVVELRAAKEIRYYMHSALAAFAGLLYYNLYRLSIG